MTPDRWARIEEIFNRALELSGGARSAYLSESCGDDSELLREVRGMLDAADETVGSAVSAFAVTLVASRGDRVGPYRLVREIGQGGMGTVYEAVRDDDQYRKKVAIKVVKRGMDSAEVLARFRHERQILAGLEHPNIARLIDGGTLPASHGSLPFLVMEYVEGVPLSVYCARHGLPVAERLRLFQSVCSAVQHAHQSLVVHRDLKPGNILVTAEGVAKLLDFGIAKLADPSVAEDTLLRTSTGMHMLTPDYASPEQVRGEPVTTASDIYSLGVVLYELLTGERPYRLKESSWQQIDQAVCQTEVAPPSTKIEVNGKLRQELRGDLDTIVLMAMRKEPARRYRSAAELSDDIGRYLDGRPITARKDTFRYRASKFARRNKAVVAAAVLAIAGMLAGTLAVLHQARRAERRFAQVRKLANTFLFEFDEKLRNVAGTTEVRELAVKTALEYLDSLTAEATDDPGLTIELAKAYTKVGDVQGHPRLANLGKTAEAMDSYRKAVALAGPLVTVKARDARAIETLAQARIQLGALESEQGRAVEGIANLQEGVRLTRTLMDLELGQRAHAIAFVSGSNTLGDALINGDPAGAEAAYRDALDAAPKLGDTPESRRQMALCLERLGRAQHERGDPMRAISSYDKALAIVEDLAGADSSDSRYKRHRMVIHNYLGNLHGNSEYFDAGQPERALHHYRTAFNIIEELASADPKNRLARFDSALVRERMGRTLLALGRASEGAGLLLEARDRTAALVAESPGSVHYQRALNQILLAVPAALRATGQPGAARAAVERALRQAAVFLTQLPTDLGAQVTMASAWLTASASQRASRDWAEARVSAGKALAIVLAQHRKNPKDLYFLRDTAEAYTELGEIEAGQGGAGVCGFRRQALETWERWPAEGKSSVYFFRKSERARQALARCSGGGH